MPILRVWALLAWATALISYSLAINSNNCTPGTFFNGKSCVKCHPGRYQDKPGATRCMRCPRGTYNLFRGAQGIDLCEPCRQGTFNNVTGATSPKACKKCPKGTTSVKASARCISCPPGTYVSAFRNVIDRNIRGYNCDRTIQIGPGFGTCYARNYPFIPRCIRCPRNTASNKRNVFECPRCEGESFAEPGQRRCIFCPAGKACPNRRINKQRLCKGYKFSSEKSSICNTCPPGFQGNAETGAVTCVPCRRRSFRGVGRSPARCFRCAPGENTKVSGARACIPDSTACPANYFRNYRGTCDLCAKSHRLNKAKRRCDECPLNQENDGGIDPECRPCSTGASREAGEETCSCKPGWERVPARKFTCRICPAGKFFRRDRRCVDCPAGTYTATVGKLECTPCPFNRVQPLPGQTKCVGCPKGMLPNPIRGCLSPVTNCPPGVDRLVDDDKVLLKCNIAACPVGSFLITRIFLGFRINSCDTCSTAERYDPMFNQCVSCNFDEVSEGGLSTVCRKCPEGQFRSGFECFCGQGTELVNGKCRKCPPGSISAARGTGCIPCPPGTFRSSTTFCRDCPPGTFSNEAAESCSPCPQGSNSYLPRSANCVVPGGLASK